MPNVIIEDIEPNTSVTVIVQCLYEVDGPSDSPEEKPEGEESKTVWLASKRSAGSEDG
jgi:hypothetical protein